MQRWAREEEEDSAWIRGPYFTLPRQSLIPIGIGEALGILYGGLDTHDRDGKNILLRALSLARTVLSIARNALSRAKNALSLAIAWLRGHNV